MEEFKDAEKKARLLTRRLIDKLVKSPASGSRMLESELHIRHGFIKAVLENRLGSGESLTCVQLLAANMLIERGYLRRIEMYRAIRSPQADIETRLLDEWRKEFIRLLTQPPAS